MAVKSGDEFGEAFQVFGIPDWFKIPPGIPFFDDFRFAFQLALHFRHDLLRSPFLSGRFLAFPQGNQKESGQKTEGSGKDIHQGVSKDTTDVARTRPVC